MILTVPWLLALREAHPGSSLHLLCHAGQGELLRCLGIVDEFFPDEGSGWHGFFSDTPGELSLKLRPDPCEYQTVYIFLSESGRGLALALRKRIEATVIELPARPSPFEALHASHLPFRATGMLLEERFFRGLPQEQRKSKEARFFVHPGSGSGLKNWPPENFAGLMKKASESLPLAEWTVLEGPSDQETVAALCRLWKGHLQVFRPGSLCRLASILKEGYLFVGNDSGVTHLAAFLGIPTLALFGPSDPKIWSPLGRQVRVRFHQDTCPPCHLSGRRKECGGPCRRFPSVGEAWEALLCLAPFI